MGLCSGIPDIFVYETGLPSLQIWSVWTFLACEEAINKADQLWLDETAYGGCSICSAVLIKKGNLNSQKKQRREEKESKKEKGKRKKKKKRQGEKKFENRDASSRLCIFFMFFFGCVQA